MTAPNQAHGGAIWPSDVARASDVQPAYLVKDGLGNWMFDTVGPAEGKMVDTGVPGSPTLYELTDVVSGTPIDVLFLNAFVGGAFVLY